jgi:hypothetical protein
VFQIRDSANNKAHPTRPGPTRLEKQGSNNVKQRSGGVRMREQRLRPAMESGKSGPRRGTKVGTVLQIEAPTLRASNILKRPHSRRGVLPVSSSDTKQSEGISAQRIDFVVISDTEPESTENGKYYATEGSSRNIAKSETVVGRLRRGERISAAE